MNISRILNFLMIVIGCIIAIYAKSDASQNQYLLIIGIMLLMLGLYRLSRGISDRKPNDTFVVEEKKDETEDR